MSQGSLKLSSGENAILVFVKVFASSPSCDRAPPESLDDSAEELILPLVSRIKCFKPGPDDAELFLKVGVAGLLVLPVPDSILALSHLDLEL